MSASDFTKELEEKVFQQLKSQRVSYLLGAGSSYLDGRGYPLAAQLWDMIKDGIPDTKKRDEIQEKLDSGANGIEKALDLLDDGSANDTPYRHLVTDALANVFMSLNPPIDIHREFVRRIAKKNESSVKVFSLNYDPLIEWAATDVRARVVDGYLGQENSYFDPSVFDERVVRIRGAHRRTSQFDETKPIIHLLKLHGSLGWYECPKHGARRCGFRIIPPNGTKRLMIPPQRRKAEDTMNSPYSALWSAFRGCLAQNSKPTNRLVCIGYGFADEHVNTLIESALVRSDFTLLIFSKELTEHVWSRWCTKSNCIVITENRCAIKGRVGPGHSDLWSFERLSKEV